MRVYSSADVVNVTIIASCTAVVDHQYSNNDRAFFLSHKPYILHAQTVALSAITRVLPFILGFSPLKGRSYHQSIGKIPYFFYLLPQKNKINPIIGYYKSPHILNTKGATKHATMAMPA